MDQNAGASITQEYRDKIYKELAEIVFNSLEMGEISVVDSKEISQYILDHLDILQTNSEINTFLTEISRKWPIFQSFSLTTQDENNTQEKIEEIKHDINQISNN